MNSRERLQKAMTHAMANRPQVGGFPYLAECLRMAGARFNIWSLPTAQSIFIVSDGTSLVNQGAPLVTSVGETHSFDQESLIKAIRRDQAGESTFQEFLVSAWNAGVVGYVVDFEQRTVTYLGANDETYTEAYPVTDVPGLAF
jgi:uncharacterized protein YbcV (DUF1398 family)